MKKKLFKLFKIFPFPIERFLINAFNVFFVNGKFSFDGAKILRYYKLFRRSIFFAYDIKKIVKKNQLTNAQLEAQRFHKFELCPLISILTPAYNTRSKYIDELIESLQNQTYSNWELCIANAGTLAETHERLKYWAGVDKRIKWVTLASNMGIGGNTNKAFEFSSGDYVGLLDHDDLLAINALYEVVSAINSHNADMIYTDEDKISESGKIHFDYNFKPDWSPDALRSANYICHFTILKKELFEKIGGFSNEFNGSQDYDLILRASEKAAKIIHIPKILYHWRACETSVALNPEVKEYCYEAAKSALSDHLERIGHPGTVEYTPLRGFYRIKHHLINEPLVSVIMYAGFNESSHKTAVKDHLNIKLNYKNYEVITVESSGSLSPVAARNYGASIARGEFLVFLDHRIEVITENWINEMLTLSQTKNTGVVGAKILNPDNTIFNAGFVVSSRELACSPYKNYRHDEIGYCGRLTVIHNVSAVSGHCFLVEKKMFLEAGCFDEKYKESYFDIDFCLRVREMGKFNVFTPYAQMYLRYPENLNFLELLKLKISKLFNSNNNTSMDEVVFRDRWHNVLAQGDPYYSPNVTYLY